MNSAATGAALGLSAAGVWGGADFAGGLAARRAPSLLVVAVAHGLSLLALLAVLPLAHESWPGLAPMLIPLLGGIAGGFGLVLFYYALSLGAMGLTAAVTGLATACIPVIFGFATEGLPRPIQLAGFAVAAIALWLITTTQRASKVEMMPLLLGLGSGVCFSGMMISLKVGAAMHGVLWTLSAARLGSVLLTGTLLLSKLRNKALAVSRPGWFLLSVWAGALDTSGNLLFTLATKAGRLDMASILSSLYPAGTILLAAFLLHEHPTRRQWAGIALAMAAVLLVTA
jgi:drug/metabolite transporter (DMT)-like permease